MFTGFLYTLRTAGLKVSLTEWLALMEALSKGHARANLEVFYSLARALLVKKESDYDRFDQAFAHYFEGVAEHFDVDEELLKWLGDPILPKALSEDERAALEALDIDELRRRFAERLAEQKERHDGGNHWIGTGGSSPFGHGGTHPTGLRIGGPGGGRSAMQVAEARRFRNLRNDRVLDTRQLGGALRRLRRLAQEGPREDVLDVEKTIDRSASQGGEIELVFGPERKNRIRLLLLMDVGGSMDPHAERCEQLFSAAHAADHFASFQTYFFHNCVYDILYTDMARLEGVPTTEVLDQLDHRWMVLLVGDAWMHPFELSQPGGAIDWSQRNQTTGLEWLRRIRERVPRSVWLNPEPPRVWEAPSVSLVRSVFPMEALTLEGLTRAVDMLRGARSMDAPLQPSGR